VCGAGAVAIGSVGLAKAKADHDESLGDRKGMHELSPEQKKELKTIAPVREEYLDGGLVVLVGKDTEAAVGMRVRMRDGLISHGEIEFVVLFQSCCCADSLQEVRRRGHDYSAVQSRRSGSRLL
jgi:hypothetical protein